MEKFYEHLDAGARRDRLPRSHRRGPPAGAAASLFNRAVLDQNEINILRGILTAVQGRRRRAGDPASSRPRQGTSMTRTVYLDNAATTPVDPRVAAEMLRCLAAPTATSANRVCGQSRARPRARARASSRRARRSPRSSARPRERSSGLRARPRRTTSRSSASRASIADAAAHLVTSRTEHAAVLDRVPAARARRLRRHLPEAGRRRHRRAGAGRRRRCVRTRCSSR